MYVVTSYPSPPSNNQVKLTIDPISPSITPFLHLHSLHDPSPQPPPSTPLSSAKPPTKRNSQTHHLLLKTNNNNIPTRHTPRKMSNQKYITVPTSQSDPGHQTCRSSPRNTNFDSSASIDGARRSSTHGRSGRRRRSWSSGGLLDVSFFSFSLLCLGGIGLDIYE